MSRILRQKERERNSLRNEVRRQSHASTRDAEDEVAEGGGEEANTTPKGQP